MYSFFIEKECKIENLDFVLIEFFETKYKRLFLNELKDLSQKSYKDQIGFPKIFVRYDKEKWIELILEGSFSKSIYSEYPSITIIKMEYYEKHLE